MSTYTEISVDSLDQNVLRCCEMHFSSLRVDGEFANIYVVFNLNIFTSKDLFRQMVELFHKQFVQSERKRPIIIFSMIDDDSIKKFIESYPHTSVIFNSSIWIRHIRFYNQPESEESQYHRAENELKNFQKLFDNSNAIEYFEYQLRLQSVNYLSETKKYSVQLGDEVDHSPHSDIPPTLYSNENDLRDEIQISKDLKFFFRERTGNEGIKGMQLRILLIDDKIGNGDDCKAMLVKKLLQLDFEKKDNIDSIDNLKHNVCWLTADNSNYDIVEKVNIENKQDLLKIEKMSPDKIQLIAVKSLEDARMLLENKIYRFDLILMDYLLGRKNNNSSQIEKREYATEFWGDGVEKYFEMSEYDMIKYSNDKVAYDKYSKLIKTYDAIKATRGPLHRLWIFPITAFNQTFIDDLRNKGIRLIDYYWYLNGGADPINTPYLFIYALNKFLQLQVENAIFSKSKIFRFLKKSALRLAECQTFDQFNAFMGAEYAVFVEKYMMRPVIYRDKQAGSLFAKYIWLNFYAKYENLDLFQLTNQIQKFYHRCAFGTTADYDKMILFWRELKVCVIEKYGDDPERPDLDVFFKKLTEIA